MFILTPFYSWSDKRDSAYRVAPLDERLNGYREFLINPNRLNELIEGSDSTIQVPTSWFKFYDNHLNLRESWSYGKAYIAVATIIATADVPYHSTMVTLPICRHNNPDALTVDTTLPVSCIAYFDRYNPRPTEFVWVCWYSAAFKRHEQLVKYSLEDIEDLLESGTTTSSTER